MIDARSASCPPAARYADVRTSIPAPPPAANRRCASELIQNDGAEKVGHGEIRQKGVFPEALHLEPGKEREKVELLPLQHRDRIGDGGRRVYDVRVGEQNQFARGSQGSLEESMRLAEPALGRLDARHDHEARILRGHPGQNLARPVGGAVVHDDDFESRVPVRARLRVRARARPRVVLQEMRAHGLLDGAGLVPRGDHDGHAGLRPGSGARRSDAPDREEIDEEEDEADGRQRGRRDQSAVEEGYDSGTFCRASAR